MRKNSNFLTKKQSFFIGITIGLICLIYYFSYQPTTITSYESCDVCFSPHEHCTNKIIHYIETAEKTIFVQAFVLTSYPITNSLIKAFRRGINVNVILDGKQVTSKRSLHPLLIEAGIQVYIDKIKGGLAHNKIMIFDEDIVLTGSFNFSKNADTKNAENILILKDKVLAAHYLENWRQRRDVSMPLMHKNGKE
ncbi:MAG: phospholipase D family protein [Proteobacteria bacterium]|nr:phospholipase D family protein [Pseudomonadota bacterium]